MRREYDLSKMKCRRDPYSKRLAGLPEQIQSLAGRIAEEISPQRIILFGSHAQGTFGPDSDVDLLVITDRPAGRQRCVVKTSPQGRVLLPLGLGRLRRSSTSAADRGRRLFPTGCRAIRQGAL